MEPIRRPSGRRLLLPYEIDLCESLGITADEYWEFLAAAQEHVKERGDEYALIPDVRNEPVSIIVNIVIGVALSALASLLAPKPKQPDRRDPKRLEIAGRQGRTQYTRSNNFDSVQQLANLGATIPLIFAKYLEKDGVKYGGVRVDTELLHSQMISSGNNQLLFALMMFGMAELDGKPDYDGYAIGDLLLRDFSEYRSALYFGQDKRLTTDDLYSRSKLEVDGISDAFSVFWPKGREWKTYFSGTRTPSSKTQFGLHSPIPNGHRFYLPLELVMVIDKTGKTAKEDAREKRKKLGNAYARYCGITAQNRTQITYKISGKQLTPDKYLPWGQADTIAIQNETRTSVDEALQQNQEFMFGSGVIGRLKSGPTAPAKQQPWDKDSGLSDNSYEYIFELDQNVRIDKAKNGDIDDPDDSKGGARPWFRSAIQQVAVASLTNSRPCHATEIGIKSEVWRQMTGAVNFNGWPKNDIIEEYEDNGDSISLGTVSQYMKRYSFFNLYVRPLGENVWESLNGGAPFAVRGTSPINQYNTIHINHPGTDLTAQEYKIEPVPGFVFYNDLLQGLTKTIKLFNGLEIYKVSTTNKYTVNTRYGEYNVSFTGINDKTFTQIDANNSEWIFGFEGGLGDRERSGPIASLTDTQSPAEITLPPVLTAPDTLIADKYKPNQDNKSCVQLKVDQNGNRVIRFFWEGVEKEGTQGEDEFEIITMETGQRKFRYKAANLRQPLLPDRYEPTPASPDYVVTDDPSPLGPGYVTCVYKYNGIFYWRWANKTVATQRSTSTNPSTEYFDSGKYRYRVELDQNGTITPPRTEEKITWTDDEMLYDLFVKDNKKHPHTGAVLLDDGKWRFWKDGRQIGTNNGGGRNLYDGTVGESNRWRATNVEREYVPYSEELEGRYRECDPSVIGEFKECVETGFILLKENGVQLTVTVWNDNRTNSKQVPKCKMFLFGEKVLNDVAAEDYYGVNVEYKNPDDGLVYRPFKAGLSGGSGEEDPPMVGKPEKKSPCYRVQALRIVEEQREQRAITRQYINTIYPTWSIEQEEFIDGQPAKFEIERWKADNTTTETPEIRTVKLRSNKFDGSDGEDGELRNTSAEAEVEIYKQAIAGQPEARAYRWKLIEPGNGYVAKERVELGKLGVFTTVAQIQVGDNLDDDGDPEWDQIVGDNKNYFPLNAICDYYINNTDTSSHANGPEHNVVFCNELIRQSAPNYENLALAGIKITNSKEWSNFSNLSAWLGKGIKVNRLITSNGCTNLFPEIAYTLLTNDLLGAGKFIGKQSVNKADMTIAAHFCEANNFYWDGVIAESVNLREFIFENAAYILCDFTIKGGKFALIPSVPYDLPSYRINRSKPITIKALFTDGNMRNMQVSFLTPEERQLFKAVVLYRDETVNGFAETRTMTTYLNSGSVSDPVEEFDLTTFCTSEQQARMFSRTALKLRELVDHGITFETTPQSAMNLEPGEYFKVATKTTHTNRFQSGSIDDVGNVIALGPDNTAGNFNIVYWRPGDTETRSARLNFTSNKTSQTALWGCIWTKVTDSENTRVYKCETLSYSDEGLVTVAGSFTPLTDRGSLAILDYDESEFNEELA